MDAPTLPATEARLFAWDSMTSIVLVHAVHAGGYEGVRANRIRCADKQGPPPVRWQAENATLPISTSTLARTISTRAGALPKYGRE